MVIHLPRRFISLPTATDCFRADRTSRPNINKKILKQYYLVSDKSTGSIREKKRKNLATILQNTTVIPFKWQGVHLECDDPSNMSKVYYNKYVHCFYCCTKTTTTKTKRFPGLRQHTLKCPKLREKISSVEFVVKVDVSKTVCKLCSEEFSALDELISHLVDDHSLPYYWNVVVVQQYRLKDMSCAICGRQFDSVRSLVEHVVIFHPLKSYICEACGEHNIFSKLELAKHSADCNKRECYICKECGCEFSLQAQLNAHIVHMHIKNCPYCDVSCVDMKKLKYHLHLYHNINFAYHFTQKCIYCDITFFSLFTWKLHMSKCAHRPILYKSYASQHRSEWNNIQCVLNLSTAMPFGFKRKLYCIYCLKKFDDFKALSRHTLMIHPVCKLKVTGTFSEEKLNDAIKVNIADLRCKICSVPLASIKNFMEHAITVHKAKYDSHIFIKPLFNVFFFIDERFWCLEPDCGNAFQFLSNLMKHIDMNHSAESSINLYKCSQCRRGFPASIVLKAHMLAKHSGPRKISKASDPSLRPAARMVTVTTLPENEFKCSLCPESFETSAREHKHRVEAHNITDYDTPAPVDRNTSERRRKNLKTIFDNSTILPFKWRGTHTCYYCSVPFSDYIEFRKHTKSHGKFSIQNYVMKNLDGLAINVDVSEVTCELCKQQFKSVKVIVEHLINEHNLFYDKEIFNEMVEYRLIDFQCTHCDLQFDTFRNLVSHVNKHHPPSNYVCNLCGQKFNKKRDITSHINNSHRLRGYICIECGEEFKSRPTLQKHEAHAHIKRCHVCGEQFMNLNEMLKHINLKHSNDDNKTCCFCMKEFQSAVGLKTHFAICKVRLISQHETKRNHGSARASINQSRTKEQIVRIRENIQCVLNMSTAIPFRFRVAFSCFYCSLKYDDYEVLKQHTQAEHPTCDIKCKSLKKCKGSRTFVRVDIADLNCKLCSAPMPDLEHFIDHALSVHDANYDKTISIETCFEAYRLIKGNIPCLECPKVFRYLNTMLRHFNLEHSNNNVICDYCGRGFRSSGNLTMHLQNTHIGSRECNICNAKFKNLSILVRHMAKCHAVKTFKCGKCSEMFESEYQRKTHLIKVHGIGHKCEHCGKMFTKHSFMDLHVRRTHLKEKNVTCSVCNDKFFDNHLLRMHMVKHDGERKFKCELCGKAFLRQKNLRTHMNTHKKYGFVQ